MLKKWREKHRSQRVRRFTHAVKNLPDNELYFWYLQEEANVYVQYAEVDFLNPILDEMRKRNLHHLIR